MPPPMSSTWTWVRPRLLFKSKASSTAVRTPATRISTPMPPLPTCTWTQLSHVCLLKASRISVFLSTGTPNFEYFVETERAAIFPAPTSGLIRKPMSDVQLGILSRISATTASSSQLSTFTCIPRVRACLISAGVFSGESYTTSLATKPSRSAWRTSPMLAHSAPKPNFLARRSMGGSPFDFSARAWKKPSPNASCIARKFASQAPKS
mmetsp:Transcript_60218/g.168073  ORF Transcript_60218/g.168073 Transcript_60218/m.168073 type:complete len:208 (-) Transcript_60218:235-858(-)